MGPAVGIQAAAVARVRSFPVCVHVTWTRRVCGGICKMSTKHRKVFSKTSTYLTVIEPKCADNCSRCNVIFLLSQTYHIKPGQLRLNQKHTDN